MLEKSEARIIAQPGWGEEQNLECGAGPDRTGGKERLMRLWLTLGLLALPALAPAAGTGQDAAKKEQQKLQGTWKVTALTYNGKDFFAKGQAAFDFIIKGDEIVVQGNDAVKKEYARLRFKLDPSVMPKIFDLTVTSGVQADAKLEGIYELQADELKLCVRVFGQDRPNQFDAAGGSNNAFLVLKKQ
jgi:uncharacterized protein (TIGR03067 family)